MSTVLRWLEERGGYVGGGVNGLNHGYNKRIVYDKIVGMFWVKVLKILDAYQVCVPTCSWNMQRLVGN